MKFWIISIISYHNATIELFTYNSCGYSVWASKSYSEKIYVSNLLQIHEKPGLKMLHWNWLHWKFCSKVILYLILFLNFFKLARVLLNHIWVSITAIPYNFLLSVKGAYLGSNLFPDKACHNNEQLYKILFSNDIFFMSYFELKFWWCLYNTFCVWRMNESSFKTFLLQK